MNKFQRFAVFVIMFTTIFMGCSNDMDDVVEISIVNNSNVELVFYDINNKQSQLDTSVRENNIWEGGVSDWYIIESYSSKEITEIKSVLESTLSEGWYQVYFFVHDTVKNNSWEQIREHYMVAKRVDIGTWEDLETMNFTISYP